MRKSNLRTKRRSAAGSMGGVVEDYVTLGEVGDLDDIAAAATLELGVRAWARSERRFEHLVLTELCSSQDFITFSSQDGARDRILYPRSCTRYACDDALTNIKKQRLCRL